MSTAVGILMLHAGQVVSKTELTDHLYEEISTAIATSWKSWWGASAASSIHADAQSH